MTEKRGSWTKKILKDLDRRILYLIIIIMVSVTMVYPIGMPITMDKMSRDYYNAIESLPPGSVVFLSLDVEAGLWGQLSSQVINTLDHLFSKDGIKFIQVCTYRADGVINFETLILPAVNPNNRVKKEYGVDWVNLGFIQGGETAMSALAHNLLVSNVDAYGNQLKDLPLMQEVKNMEGIDIGILGGGGDGEQKMRQMLIPYKIPVITIGSAATISQTMAFIDSGVIVGNLNDLLGAAQYESLRGIPGRAIAKMDAISAVHIALIAFSIVANSVVVYERFIRRKKE